MVAIVFQSVAMVLLSGCVAVARIWLLWCHYVIALGLLWCCWAVAIQFQLIVQVLLGSYYGITGGCLVVAMVFHVAR